jgi:hypothetical protein
MRQRKEAQEVLRRLNFIYAGQYCRLESGSPMHSKLLMPLA